MEKKCTVDVCEKPSRYRGYCSGHYCQIKKHGKIVRPVLGLFKKRICTVDGCEQEKSTKLYCNAHYLQMKNHGRITSVDILCRNKGNPCKVTGCQNESRCKGYCRLHYKRLLKHGDVNLKRSPGTGEMRAMGYVYLRKKDHPRADKRGYVKRANIVWEENTGHVVTPPEVLHHINGIKDDDTFENLLLLPTLSAHTKLHGGRSRYSKETIKEEMLRVYSIIGPPLTVSRYKELATISVTTIVEHCGWNNLKEELCIK